MRLHRLSNIVALFGLFVVAWWLMHPARAIQGTGFFCSKSAFYDNNANGATRIITADGTPNQIYICGYILQSGPTPTNVGLVYGVGNRCSGGGSNFPMKLTPMWELGANQFTADNSSGWRGVIVPSGYDVCVNTSAGNPVQMHVFYEVAP